MNAHIVGIYLSPAATVLPAPVEQAEARADRGLIGDRYFDGCGTFSDAEPVGPGRELTLIEKEVLDAVGLSAAEARRNLVTEGVRLNDLVGVTFQIGAVQVRGIRLCHPCAHLDKVTGRSLLKILENRGGLRAAILNDGFIRVGETVTLMPDL